MTTTLDTRVVEMQFDNAAFERGVKQTTQSLENLDKVIDNAGKSSGGIFASLFGGLSKGISNLLPIQAITGAASAVGGAIESIFSKTFDVIGTVSKVGIGTLTALGASITGLAATGGFNRALNIENAQFQLKGLMKDAYDWDLILEDLNTGVKDTAYGLDSAAKTAAQLYASGIKFGEDMPIALRAISGIASQTNREYDEIAHIFTRVAGMGHVTGDDLRSLASTGLNATAILGQALDKTEEEIRDMVSKGQIDFQTFSRVMNEAFGDNAKKANETFTGAMRNVRAALSRTGEKFADIYLKNMREIFVSLIGIINVFNNSLSPAIEAFGSLFGSVTSKIVGFLSQLTDPSKTDKWGRTIISQAERTQKRLTNIFTNMVDTLSIIRDRFINGLGLTTWGYILGLNNRSPQQILTEIDGFFGAIKSIVEDLDFTKMLRFGVTMPLQNIVMGFRDAFNAVKDYLSITEKLEGWEQYWSAAKGDFVSIYRTKEQSNLQRIFENISTVISTAGDFLSHFIMVWNAFMKAGIEAALPIFDAFTQLLANFANILEDVFSEGGGEKAFFLDLANGAARLKELLPSAEQLAIAVSFLTDMFRILVETLYDLIPGADGTENAFETIKSGVQGFYDLILGKTGTVTRLFSGFLETIKSYVPDFTQLSAVVKSAGGALNAIFSAIGETLDKADILSKIGDFFKNIRMFDVIASFNLAGLLTAVTMIDNTLSGIKGGLEDASKWKFPTLANLLGFGPALNSIRTAFVELQGALKAQIIGKIAIALIAFAGAMVILSTVDWDKMPQIAAGLAMFTGVMIALIKALDTLAGVSKTTRIMGRKWNFFSFFKDSIAESTTGFTKTYNGIAQLGVLVAAIGVAVLLMASAMKKMASIDPEQFKIAAAGMLVVLSAFAAIIVALGVVNSASKGFAGLGKSAGALVAIGTAFLLLAASMRLLGRMDPSEFRTAFASMIIIASSISAILLILSHLNVTSSASLATAALMFATIGPMFLLMAASIKILSTIDADSAAIAIDSMAATVIGLMGLIVAIGAFPSRNIAAGSLLFASVSVLLVSIAATFKMLSSIDDTGVSSAVQSITAVFVVLGVAVAVLAALNAAKVAIASTSLVLMAASLLLLAPAFKILSTIPTEGVVSALIAIGGAIAILGVAATVIPTAALVAFAASVLAIGVGLLAIGGGFALAGAGALMFVAALGELLTIIETVASTVGTAKANVDRFSKAVVDFIVSLMKNLAQQAEPLAKTGTEIFLAFIKAIGMKLGELAGLGMRMVIALLDGVRQTIGPIIATGVEIIVQLIAGIASKIDDLIEAAMWVGIMFIKGLADGIRENIQYVFMAMDSLMNAIGAALLWGLADILESNPLTAPLAQMIRDGGDELAAASAESSAKIEAAFNERFDNIEARADQLPEHVSAVIGDEAKYVAAGEAIPEGVATGMDSNSGVVDSALDGIIDDMAGGFDAAPDIFSEEGSTEALAWVEGYSSNSDDIISSIVDPAQEGIDEASAIDSESAGDTVGGNFGSGVYSGIDKWRSYVTGKARQMVREAKDAANEEMNAASPSKDMIKSGGWFGEGFMIGIEQMIDPIAKTATDMASEAKGAVEDVLFSTGNMFDMIDFDANPVISPVLDTSRIQAGLAGMYGMFGNPSLAYDGYGFSLSQEAMPRVPIQSARSDRANQNSTTNLYINGDLLRSDDDLRNMYENWTMEVRRRVMK